MCQTITTMGGEHNEIAPMLIEKAQQRAKWSGAFEAHFSYPDAKLLEPPTRAHRHQ
jgi:hypothetical protein